MTIIGSPPYSSQDPLQITGRVNFSGGVSGVSTQQYKNTNIWYVDKTNNSGSGDGKSWVTAFATITEALAVAGNYDTVFIGPGFYTEATALTITKVGLKIFGMNSSGKTRGPCAMKTPTAVGHMLIINANDVEIAGLGFIATDAYNAITLGAAAEGYIWRSHIHDCSFHGDDLGLYAIAVYGATTTPAGGAFPDVAECVVENCYFYAWVTAGTCTYGTRVMTRNNVFFPIAAGNGIIHGAGRPFAIITGNVFNGVNSTDVGIVITGDVGTHIIDHNTFLNLSLAVTQDVGIAAISSENYKAVTNGVYTVVDTTAA